MSKLIYTFQLNDHQQDILWSDTCPLCSAKIIVYHAKNKGSN